MDTETHLATLLIQSDPEALADLRRRALEPLSELRPSAAERLEQTLRSWLLHQGRRDDVAAELMVHPQTVRYRMTQLRGSTATGCTIPRRSSTSSSPSAPFLARLEA